MGVVTENGFSDQKPRSDKGACPLPKNTLNGVHLWRREKIIEQNILIFSESQKCDCARRISGYILGEINGETCLPSERKVHEGRCRPRRPVACLVIGYFSV